MNQFNVLLEMGEMEPLIECQNVKEASLARRNPRKNPTSVRIDLRFNPNKVTMSSLSKLSIKKMAQWQNIKTKNSLETERKGVLDQSFHY